MLSLREVTWYIKLANVNGDVRKIPAGNSSWIDSFGGLCCRGVIWKLELPVEEEDSYASENCAG
jgi:hypothetical protein